jgi:hypothetical protein
MHELFPILSGLALGAALGLLRPGIRMPFGIAVAVVLGAIATIISGEYEISWAFLIIDIPLVWLTAAAALAGLRTLRRLLPRNRRI